MWLSEAKKRADTECTDAAVRISSGETSDVLRPANILRMPKSGEAQLVMSCSDGSTVQLGVIGDSIPDGLSEGELYIETANARITIKNNGAVNIEGSVNISGSLTVNGVSI